MAGRVSGRDSLIRGRNEGRSPDGRPVDGRADAVALVHRYGPWLEVASAAAASAYAGAVLVREHGLIWALPGLAALAVVAGSVPLLHRRWIAAVLRGVVAVALVFAASAAVPGHQVDLLIWFSYLGIVYGLVLGLRRSLPVQVGVLAGLALGSYWALGPGPTLARALPALGCVVVAGIVGDALGMTVEAAERERRRADRRELQVAQIRTLIDAAPLGIVFYDGEQRSFVNQRAAEICGCSVEQLLESGFRDVIHPDDNEIYEAVRDSLALGVAASYMGRTRDELGGRTVRVDIAPVKVEGTGVAGTVAMLSDVSADVKRERWLWRFAAMAESTSDIIGMMDVKGQTIYLNPAGRAFAGIAHDAALDQFDAFSIVPVEYHEALIGDAYQRVLAGERWGAELDLVSPTSGRRIPVSAVVVGIPSPAQEVEALGVVYRDMSERKRLESRLAHAAAHDALTGLPNREHLFEELLARMEEADQLTVLFCDLDNFKLVNDSLGHRVGDELLQAIGARLRTACRNEDVIGRLGGDEFLVVCSGLEDSEEAIEVAERLQDAIRRPVLLNGREHVVTASIGIASWGGGPLHAGELVQDADIAMYHAKRSGRRRAVVFDEAMRTQIVDRLELERDLRLALEHEEFELHFQPIYDTAAPTIVGFEALVRWRHPSRGLLLPAHFLDLAVEVGLANELGDRVLRGAADALARLQAVDPEIQVGINIASSQLLSPGLVESLALGAEVAGVSPSGFVLEITEHALMSDLAEAKGVLDRLRTLGVQVAIDDFGTGYSSLAMLRRLPVEYLKIDRSFIDGLGVDTGDTQIVGLVLSLAHELGMSPVAEGVETELQLRELRRLGCESAQGFWFSPPLPIEGALALLVSSLAASLTN